MRSPWGQLAPNWILGIVALASLSPVVGHSETAENAFVGKVILISRRHVSLTKTPRSSNGTMWFIIGRYANRGASSARRLRKTGFSEVTTLR